MGITAVVTCPGCGQQLRLPADLGTIHASCPMCRSSWDWDGDNLTNIQVVLKPAASPPPSASSQPRPASPPAAGDNTALVGCVSLIVVCVVGFLIYRGVTYAPARPLPEEQSKQPTPGRKPIWVPPGPELPLPVNGHGVYNFDKASATSTLQINSWAGQGHLIVKIEKPHNKEIVCWFLIHDGESHKTPFPPGSYQIKLAIGKTWYGEDHLFGSNASYSIIEELITVPERTNQSISLTPTVKGDIHVKAIGSKGF